MPLNPEDLIYCSKMAAYQLPRAVFTFEIPENAREGVVKSITQQLSIISTAQQMSEYIKTFALNMPQREFNAPYFFLCQIDVTLLSKDYSGYKFEKCLLINKLPQIKCESIVSCEVRGGYDFTESVFLKDSLLRNSGTTQGLNCIIDNCITESHLSIQNCIITNSKLNNVSASNSVQIEACQINNLNVISHTHLSLVNSNIIQFRAEGVNFNAALVSHTTFIKPLFISNSEFGSKNVAFEGNTFSDQESLQALGSFRQLKKMSEDAGYEHGVIDFHALELQTYYNLKFKDKWPEGLIPEKISSWFNKVVTDYGRNCSRPLWMMFFIWLICSSIYYSVGYTLDPNWNSYLEKLDSSMVCSIRNSLGPLILALKESGKGFCEDYDQYRLLSILIFLQIAFCSITWFLVIFMIRRRFKL